MMAMLVMTLRKLVVVMMMMMLDNDDDDDVYQSHSRLRRSMLLFVRSPLTSSRPISTSSRGQGMESTEKL